MATAESVKTKIQGLINKSNETTGNADTDLTSAVNRLVEGYGQGGGGDDNSLDAYIEGTATEVVFPSATRLRAYAFYNDKVIQNVAMPKVTSIGDYALQNCTNLALTELPSGVTSIDSYAFYNCPNLALTQLPSGLTSISNYAFYGCSKLPLTELPSGVINIGDYAFSDCNNITFTSLPSGLTSIGAYAFKNVWGLTNITIPSGVAIKMNAFDTCSYLETVTFKGKPDSIASSAFRSCNKLKTINVPWAEGAVANAPWGATNATINYNYKEASEGLSYGLVGDTYAVYGIGECVDTNIIIPSTHNGIAVTRIEDNAFREKGQITSVTIPNSVTFVGERAFMECGNLISVTFKGTPQTLGHNAFNYCDNLTTINVPWAEGAIAYAPWGATNATINYNYKGA